MPLLTTQKENKKAAAVTLLALSSKRTDDVRCKSRGFHHWSRFVKEKE